MKYKLKCIECGEAYTEDDKIYRCRCGGKIDVETNIADVVLSKEELQRRDAAGLSIIEKYFELFPLQKKENLVSLGEGKTNLFKSRRLGEYLNLKNLYIKDETTNPTGSFKDRPITVGLNKALEFGAKVVATASSGNAATSLAAGAARAGLNCVAFVPEDIPSSKFAQLQIYGANLYRVEKREGDSRDPTVLALEMLCSLDPRIVAIPSFGTFNPYQIEGGKSIAYEISEKLNPHHVVIPVGGGGLLLGNYKGFTEFRNLGLIETIPRLHPIQATGCAPFIKACIEGSDIELWENACTVANGLADPFTWDGKQGLEAVKRTGGSAKAVEDPAILEAQRLLAKYEGVFAEPTGVTSLAGLIALVEDGVVDPSDNICVEITGSGFKDLAVLEGEGVKTELIEMNEEAIRDIAGRLLT